MQTTPEALASRGPQEQYFAKLADGHFQIQRCADCSAHQFYPRTLCMHCGGTDLAWTSPSGAGTVYSFSVVRRKPEAGGDYNVALVDLQEGVRMMTRIDDVAPDGLRIGMTVQARVVRPDGQPPLVVFVPVEAA